MNKMVLLQISEKYRKNVPLSDGELDYIIRRMTDVLLGLEALGPDHNLSCQKIRSDLDTLKGFKEARWKR